MEQSQEAFEKREKIKKIIRLLGSIFFALMILYMAFIHEYPGFKDHSEYVYDADNHSIFVLGDIYGKINTDEEWAKVENEWKDYSIEFYSGKATEKKNNVTQTYYYVVSGDIIFLYDTTLNTVVKTIRLTNRGKTITHQYQYEVDGYKVSVTVNFTRGANRGIWYLFGIY